VFVRELVGCQGEPVPSRATAILANADTAGLAAVATDKDPCTRVAAARLLAKRHDLRALASALTVAREVELLSGHRWDGQANQVFETLAATLPRGTSLHLRAEDFTDISSDSFLALARLAHDVGDKDSLRVALQAYGAFTAWHSDGLVRELARQTPRAWADWVGSLAASAPTEVARQRYRTIGAWLADAPRVKGN
jgi:hypothetical protein